MEPEDFQYQDPLKSLMNENWLDELDSYNDIEYDDYAYGVDSQSDFSWHLWYCPLGSPWHSWWVIVYSQSTHQAMISLKNRRYYHFHLGSLAYLGWDTNPSMGDEAFGIALWRLYLGRYDKKWYFGYLNENGCLKEF